MRLDEYHEKIMKSLAQYGESSYNQLWATLHMPKRTFHKKIYELVHEDLVTRYPPLNKGKPTPHTGKPVKFRLTKSGEKTVKVQDFLLQFETEYVSTLKGLIEDSREVGNRKPLTWSSVVLISKDLPICTIAHLTSREQYEKLRDKIANVPVREELGKLINSVVESYSKKVDEGIYGAQYLASKDTVCFMGFLPKKETAIIEKMIKSGLFESEYKLTRSLIKTIFFQILPSLHQRIEKSQRFREGKEGVELKIRYCYNPNSLTIEPFSDSEQK